MIKNTAVLNICSVKINSITDLKKTADGSKAASFKYYAYVFTYYSQTFIITI